MHDCLPVSCCLFLAASCEEMRKAAYSEQAAMPPWFPAAALGLGRARGGSECPQVATGGVPDSRLHPMVPVGFHSVSQQAFNPPWLFV